MKKELESKYNLKIFTDNIEESALLQLKTLMEVDVFKDCKIRVMPDVHSGSGCVIGFTGVLGDKIVANLVGVDINCLDCDTEVLTPEGWIRIADYKNQEILHYSPRTDKGSFMKPEAYLKAPCSEFWHFKNSVGLDQMLSSEHRMLVFTGYGNKYVEWKVLAPEDFLEIEKKTDLLRGYYRFKTCFDIENNPGVNLSDELIRVDIMVQADGRIRSYPNYNFVELHFKKERKIKRAQELLNAAGISYNLYKLKDGSTNITFHAPKSIDKTLIKYYRASYDQLKIVAEECLKWDGVEGYRSNYCSTNKDCIDVIQFAFLATNVRSSLYTAQKTNENHKQSYQVIPTKNKYVGYTLAPKKVPSVDGFKYCFMTSTGYFLARRNGYTFLTGNCGMRVINLGKIENPDFHAFHEHILHNVPSGKIAREEKFGFPPLKNNEEMETYREAKELLRELRCYRELKDTSRLNRSIGTLGGGEVNCLHRG